MALLLSPDRGHGRDGRWSHTRGQARRDEKRKELFADEPKPYAMVCASRASEQYFDFWQRYQSDAGRACFYSLDEAYDWLGLSEAARAAASAIIQRWEAEVAAEPAPPAASGEAAHGRVELQ